MKKFTIAAALATSLIALSASAQAGPVSPAHLQITDAASGVQTVGFRGFRGHHRFGFLRHLKLEDKCGFYLRKFKRTGRPFWFDKYEECKEDYYDNFGR